MSTLRTMFSLFKRVRYGNPDPVRDWIVLLSLFFILFIAIVLWNMRAFTVVSNGGTIGARPAAAPILDNASVETIKNVFAERAAEERKYLLGEIRYVDPSR